MKRWTIDELRAADNLLFAYMILAERRAKIAPYTPLWEKLGEAMAELNELRSKAEASQ